MESPKSKKVRRSVGQQPKYAPSGMPLHLSTLPRFHPATYSSNSSNASSLSNTPGGSSKTTPRGSYAPPLSPNTQQRMFEAQRQLSHYQQHLIAQYAGRDQTIPGIKPDSPKLAPTTASPGPVTPLELEQEREDYIGKIHSSGSILPASGVKSQAVDSMLREESKRRSAESLSRR